MFNWTREPASVAKARSIPVLSQEEMKQVSGASFLLTEDSFLLTEDSFLLTEDSFLVTED
jgi:hypothetical protein